tara:strand:+ start:176 stop:409 length:234 start_codon:yes stop_codon:yes gene_type:complete
MEQMIINIVGAVLVGSLGFIIKTLWDGQQKIKQDMTSLERYLPETYIRRDDYKDDIADIKNMLNAIFEKLDQKVDKL